MIRHALALALAVIALHLPASAAALDAPAPGVVDGATAKTLAAAGAKIVDVRTPEEFAAAHVPGAVNIPLAEIEQRAAELGGKDAPVLLYCNKGRQSAMAATKLTELGYTKVYDFQKLSSWPDAPAK